MAHENLKKYLSAEAGKKFVASMTHSIYRWSERVPEKFYNYRIFEELTIRYATDEKTRIGLEKNDHYRFDAVFFIQPGYRALNQHQCYTVGVELKNSAEDLKYDEKIAQYLGWTDYFMIGVPFELIDAAKEKINNIYADNHDCKDKIGLVAVDTGELIICPRKQLVNNFNRLQIQEQVIYNCIFNDIKTVSFALEDIAIIPVELQDGKGEDCKEDFASSNNEVNREKKEIIKTEKTADGVDSSSKVSPEQDPISGKEIVAIKENDKNYKKAQTEAEKAWAKQLRLENAAREAERISRLADRGETLPTSTAAMYNQLKANAKEVFWAIVDSGGHSRREQIAATTKMSLPTIDRSLPSLQKVGIVEHEGSRKTGMFVVKVSTDKSASCETCSAKASCAFKGASEGMCARHK